METLSQCIYAWMQAEDITTGQLAKKLGYKSRTSLFRVLHGKSNYQSCVQFCERLNPGLDESWKGRFRHALQAEKLGVSRLALLESIWDHLFQCDKKKAVPFSGKSPTVPISGSINFGKGGTVTLLGCTASAAFELVDELLAASGKLQVIHYFSQRELLESTDLMPGLISHMLSLRYRAMLLEEKALRGTQLPWNVAFWTGEQDACMLLADQKTQSWHALSGGRDHVQHILEVLEALPRTPLYRYDHLETSTDYIEFTERNYRMEHKCRTLIIKPTPGMQMLPAHIVESTFKDFLSENLEPVSAARETLIYIFEKRVKNFYDCEKPIYLVLSLDAMQRFARDGKLEDQFFAFRLFTEEERSGILQALHAFSRKENAFVSFLDRKSWPISVEVYDGRGALFYPSTTGYNSRQEDYRELFLPGKPFTDLMFQFAEELGIIPLSRKEDAGGQTNEER